MEQRGLGLARRRTRGGSIRIIVTGVLLGAASLPGRAPATTLVDCDSPNDFCTGDPCIVSDDLEITVASCVLDFSPRTLQVDKVVTAPNNGTLSLTAGQIVLNKKIDGQHITGLTPDGADISLITSGVITNNSRVEASGRSSAGTITLNAGGAITLNGRLRSRGRGNGATATGGTVSVTSGAAVVGTKRGRIDVRGRKNNTAGGQASVTAQTDLSLADKVDVRGVPAGTVNLATTVGNITTTDDVRAQGWPAGGGGNVSVTAANDVDIHNVNATGGTAGGGTGGGAISIMAGGDATITKLRARGSGAGVAGTIDVEGDTVAVERIDARGHFGGGTVTVDSNVGALIVDRIDVRASSGTGGTVTVSAATDGQVIQKILASGDTGGEIRITAGNDLTLGTMPSSTFDSTGSAGGVVEGQAGGNLTAEGKFEAAVGGCIGLSAGGTLSTGSASFDVPLSGSCP